MREPLFILGAAPLSHAHVPTLTRQEGVRTFLENPPDARHGGWNLTTLERAQLLPGPRLHIQNGERKFLDLYEDGTFSVIGTIDGFLGHGRWDFSRRPLINGLALVEFTYEFVFFYERLLHSYVRPLPVGIRFTVGIRHAYFTHQDDERRLCLAPGPVGDFYGFGGESNDAPNASFADSHEVLISDEEPHLDVARVSFELVRRVYNSFGFTDEAVPYTNQEQDAIDIAQIRR